MDEVSDAVSRMPLAPSAMQVSIACDLGFVVAVDLAGEGLQFDAEFLGLGGRRLPSSSRRTGWCRSW
jgi:hypothetical protein